MREPLAGVTVHIAGSRVPSSTTIATVGGSVLVLATALPKHAVILTSCYLVALDGALAVSHLRLTPTGEDLQQHTRPPGEPHATLAGACLLDHVGALQDLATATSEAMVGVDVEPGALERIAETWGPASPS